MEDIYIALCHVNSMFKSHYYPSRPIYMLMGDNMLMTIIVELLNGANRCKPTSFDW